MIHNCGLFSAPLPFGLLFDSILEFNVHVVAILFLQIACWSSTCYPALLAFCSCFALCLTRALHTILMIPAVRACISNKNYDFFNVVSLILRAPVFSCVVWATAPLVLMATFTWCPSGQLFWISNFDSARMVSVCQFLELTPTTGQLN